MSSPDLPSLNGLFAKHLPDLYAYVRRNAGGMVTARESVHDLVQSVCREVLDDLSDFEYQGEDRFRGWLHVQAQRKIRSRQRHHMRLKRDVRREERRGREEGDTDSLLACYATICTPSRAVAAREAVQSFEKALEQLPEDQRTAVTLSRVLEMPYDEIARMLDVSEAAIRGRVARGLATLASSIA